MEFDETPRFWYPRVARDELIDFYSWTIEIRPLECQENLHFFLSLYPILLSLSLSLVCSLLYFFPFLFFSFFPYPPALPYLVCSILISFHLFPFSLFSLSILFIFLFSPHFIFWITITRMDQVGETSPHFPPWPLVITMFFFLIFFIFFFPFITSCNTWLLPCVTPLRCHMAFT